MSATLRAVFNGRSVLITGHTGFKGSWLSIWLRELGARVIGYSLEPPTTPSNFMASRLGERITDIRGDVRDLENLQAVMEQYRPEFLFHLAAQPLVLTSYDNPKETFDTNAGGTVNVLEALRYSDSVQVAVCITTDKVYENREWLWGYREVDRLGGHDPYSSSKAMAELAIASYRRSFFGAGRPAVASARAGNVIGGGDFADFRLVPDCMRALMQGEPLILRNPAHVRPWQYVLESLSGYLWLAARLYTDGAIYADAWNFAPLDNVAVTTQALVERAIALWGAGSWQPAGPTPTAPPKETTLLRLSGEKAAQQLQWHTVYDWQTALAATVAWFQIYAGQIKEAAPPDMYDTCVQQIAAYSEQARTAGLPWAK